MAGFIANTLRLVSTKKRARASSTLKRRRQMIEHLEARNLFAASLNIEFGGFCVPEFNPLPQITKGSGSGGPNPTITPDYTLQLLHFADGEAGLLAPTTAQNLAALVDAFDGTYANTLILSGGDNWIPGPFVAGGTDAAVRAVLNDVSGSTIAAGVNIPIAAVDIAIHNEIGVEASAVGNHEFDLGSRVFRDSFSPNLGAAGWFGANFVHVTANLDFSGDADLASRFTNTLDGGTTTLIPEATTLRGRIAPSAVITKGGEKIGLVGATTQLIESISSPSGTEVRGFPVGPGPNGETDNMTLLAAQLQPVIDELRAEGVDKIVLMSHLQVIANEQLLATLLNGVDIILSAGSNTRLGDADDVPVAFPGHAANFAGTYPLVTAGTDGKPTLIVNTDNEYTYLGRLVVDFDAAGDIIVSNLAGLTAINGAYASTTANVAAAWGVSEANLATTAFADGTKGEEVQDLTDAVQAVIAAKDGNVAGFTNVYLQGERLAVRNQETNLGNLSADANSDALASALGASSSSTFVVSLKNGGGIRAQIGTVSAPDPVTGEVNFLPPPANPSANKPAGAVSQLDIENSLRFNNTLMAFDTTPVGLKAILEHGVASLPNQGRFPQIGGVSFSFDPTRSANDRVRNIALIDENDRVIVKVFENGVVASTAPTSITVVTLNFLAQGGDGYPIKANGDNFRYLLDGPTITLSAPVDETLDFSAAQNLPANVLGEQMTLADYLGTRYPTAQTAYNLADSPATRDRRIQNVSVRNDGVFDNLPALAVTLQNTIVSLPENASTSAATKLADIVISDDIFGTNALSLSGADAANFEIVGTELRLKAGTKIDFEARTSFAITVQVDDPAVGASPDASTNLKLSITDVADGAAPLASNSLVVVPTGSYVSGNVGVAEIVAHDPTLQRLFSLNGVLNQLDVLDISNPANPTLLAPISLSPFGTLPNSVAVNNGVIAVAMEASTKTEPGTVVLFSTAGVLLNQLTVGAQPDSLTFTPDGLKVLVANEAEPNVGDTINPAGSVSIINLATGVAAATVTTATFDAFNGQEDKLRGQGVRISAGKSFAIDAEPEYIAVSPDGLTARVTLQENNAFAVLNLTTNTITEIQALGLKDYSTGTPVVTTYDFDDAALPVIGTTATGQDLKLGGFSGLHFEGTDAVTGNLRFIANTDRGPNGEPSNVLPAVPGNERPFALPNFVPELTRFELNQTTGQVSITSRIQLTRADGTPLSGLPNLQSGAQGTAYTDEVGVDLNGNQIANDPFGADLEGIVVAPDGSFWLPDEYRPAIYHFDSTGKLLDRFIPQGTAAAAGQPLGTYGTEALPAVYGQFRRANRGFEAIALEGNKIYAFIQTNLDNPSGSAAVRNNGVIRVIEFDITTSAVTGEFVYVMRDTTAAGTAKTDKIGDAVSLGGGRFLVVERDDRTTTDSNKLIYEINLTGATNVFETPIATATSGTTLESLNPAGLVANGIRAVDKRLVVNAGAIGYTGVGKLEGLAVVDNNTIALLNDNDFQLSGAILGNGSAPLNPTPEPIRLGLIDFSGSNGLDASDRDVDGTALGGGRTSINDQPVFGLFMPDSVAAYAVGGKNYFVTANEGDDRNDFIVPVETRLVGATTYDLDDTAFPNELALKDNAVLGRLTVSSLDGDIDGDGDFDRIVSYGARSFTIWDAAGNRVFDSGDALEQITAAQVPALFNGNGAAATFDTRSDNKGPEPEGVTIGEIAGRTYAFVGLERVGGFITFDITDPLRPEFVTYTNPAAGPSGTPGQTDVSPEGIIFVSAADSPSGNPLVIIGNEVSGSATIYTVNVPGSPPVFTSGTAFSVGEANTLGATGPSTSASPYLTSANSDVQFTSILTVGDAISGYRFVGIPDGMGAYDNGDGTFTLLLNHELNNTVGIARDHGQRGAFVSRWVINKSTLEVVSIEDFLGDGTSVYLSNNNPTNGAAHTAYLAAATTVFSRLCSADLGPVSAYQWTDPVTGTTFGTPARIFQSGEESSGSAASPLGPESTVLFGRQFAFVATDDPNTTLDESGTAWELPHGGLFAWENNLASPFAQRKTIVAGLDDSNGGQIYFWVGDKQATGNVVERAGLTKQGAGDNLYVLRVPGLTTLDVNGVPTETASAPINGAFSLVNEGDVSALTLPGLEALSDSNGAAQFLRPEDGQWDPSNPNDFYFVTTHQYDQVKDGVGSQVGRSRLYRLRFTDIADPLAGGTITAVLDGTERGNMLDNMTIDGNGMIILQEDVGNQDHLGKVWQYNIATDSLTELAQHDRARFGDVGIPPVAPFSRDEESSGVIDVSSILGAGSYLVNVQAHYNIGDPELVEGGQLLLMQANVISGEQFVATITASDPDNTALTFAIAGGVDAADFTIDPLTGRLSFVVAADFEAPADADGNNVYEVQISVTDFNNPPVTQSIQVTVNNVNESPTNTTVEAVNVPENTTAVTMATGIDPEGVPLVFAISGGADASRFTINSTSGALSFLTAPNFEAPTDNGANNSYFVTVTVSDGVNPPVNKTVVVTVTPVTEVQGIDIQTGQTQRSFVRNVDVIFDSPTGIADLLTNNRLQLTRRNLDGTGGVNVPLPTGAGTTVVGNQIRLDFGAQGIGGNRNSNVGDGYYEVAVDLDGDGSFDSRQYFFRLFGDLTGDGRVDGSDKIKVLQLNGSLSPEGDANGDGVVNAIDALYSTRAFSRRLGDGLPVND